jgi:hypothetical protein
MKQLFFISSLCLSSFATVAQLPDTDIWLFDLKADTDTMIFSNPLNITRRKGYDNQPAFSPDGRYVLYTSIRDPKQSDIYKYDVLSGKTLPFTQTPTSEYSPTFMPDEKNISVVMVEKDSTQRLWKYPVKGGKAGLVLDKIDSIGYHCWISKDSLALIMITEPPTLRMANLKTQNSTLFLQGISRCIQPTEDRKGFYYMEDHLAKDSSWQFRDSRFLKKNSLLLPAASQDYVVYYTEEIPGVVIYGCNSILWGFYRDTMEVICRYDLSSLGIKKITRLALSRDKKKIALVAE